MISARGLVKRFGDVCALGGLDLDVTEGTVLGLLGPNGAGKTTAVSILTTLLEPDEGTASIAGLDLIEQPHEVRRNIGLSGQYAAVDEILSGYENLEMIGRLYHLPRSEAKRRARELLARFDLEDAADRPAKGYSGGMRRRLDLAGALVARPPVLFLDEPTTGLDPKSRNDLWQVIRELVAEGATLLLTTQYLEEADALADNIMVIDQGTAIAQGTADELKAEVGGQRIEIIVADGARLADATAVVEQVAVDDVDVTASTRKLIASVRSGADALSQVIDELDRRQIAVNDIGLRRPTLDDVFLTLTGQRASDESPASTSQENNS